MLRQIACAVLLALATADPAELEFKEPDKTCAILLGDNFVLDNQTHSQLKTTCGIDVPNHSGIGKRVSFLESDSVTTRKKVAELEDRSQDSTLKFSSGNSECKIEMSSSNKLTSSCEIEVGAGGGIGKDVNDLKAGIKNLKTAVSQLQLDVQHPCDVQTHNCDPTNGICFMEAVSAGHNGMLVDSKHMKDKVIQYHCGCKAGFMWASTTDPANAACMATPSPTPNPTASPTKQPTASPTHACSRPNSGNMRLGGHGANHRQSPRGWTFNRDVSFHLNQKTKYTLSQDSVQWGGWVAGQNAAMTPGVRAVYLDGQRIYSGYHTIRGPWYGGGGCGCGARKHVGWDHFPNHPIDLGCIEAGSHTLRFEYQWHGSTCECAYIYLNTAGTLVPY
jgi:hypothetical protein